MEKNDKEKSKLTVEEQNVELNTAYGKYIGQAINGVAHGKGTFIYTNGDKYEGKWKNGKKEGKGISKYINGDTYIGEYKDGKKEGTGTYTYEDGTTYEGDWKNGKKEGKGISKYINGDTYIGEYKDGKKEGTGTIQYANGEKYEGDWKDGKIEGNGTLTFSNKMRIEGKIDNSIFIEGKLFDDKNVVISNFKYDKEKKNIVYTPLDKNKKSISLDLTNKNIDEQFSMIGENIIEKNTNLQEANNINQININNNELHDIKIEIKEEPEKKGKKLLSKKRKTSKDIENDDMNKTSKNNVKIDLKKTQKKKIFKIDKQKSDVIVNRGNNPVLQLTIFGNKNKGFILQRLSEKEIMNNTKTLDEKNNAFKPIDK